MSEVSVWHLEAVRLVGQTRPHAENRDEILVGVERRAYGQLYARRELQTLPTVQLADE